MHIHLVCPLSNPTMIGFIDCSTRLPGVSGSARQPLQSRHAGRAGQPYRGSRGRAAGGVSARDRPLVLDDPIALRIIRPEVAHELRTNPPTGESSILGPYLRAFFVMRSR